MGRVVGLLCWTCAVTHLLGYKMLLRLFGVFLATQYDTMSSVIPAMCSDLGCVVRPRSV